MATEWIIAICSILTVLLIVGGTIWKSSIAIDRLTVATGQILSKQDAQWKRIDETQGSIENVKEEHGNRIIKLETWREIHENNHSASSGKN